MPIKDAQRFKTSHGQRTVIFLGAGASKPFGFPVTTSILSAIWNGLEDGSYRKWTGIKNRVGRDRGDKQLRALLETLLPGLKSRGSLSTGASIIDVLSLLDQLLLENRSPIPGVSEEELRRARSMLQLGINAVLRGTRNANLGDRLVNWLLMKALAPNSRVSLVSTNYDTCLEKRIFDEIVDLGASVGRHVDFGISWRDCYVDRVHVRPRDAHIAVFKLHGSLNWVRCETCGHVSINPRARIAALEFWSKVNNYNSCVCGGRLRSILVTPSVVRDVRDANLLSVWNAALEDLRRAREWIFIGYSLPSEDIAIRSLLLRAFHTRVYKARLKVRVVQWEDPQTAGNGTPSLERARYEMFFPSAHLRDKDYMTGGVELFVDSLPTVDPKALKRTLRRVTRDASPQAR